MINENELYGKPKEIFEALFQREDPWNLSSEVEKLRYKLTLQSIKKISNPHNKNILELGCAEGKFTGLLSNGDFNVTSVDISEKAIQRAVKKEFKNVTYFCSDMIDFVCNNDINNYNIILIMESIYYLDAEGRNKLLNIISNKINKDSIIFITLPIKKNSEMFPNEENFIKLFKSNNFIQIRNKVILSLIGRSGKLSATLKISLFIKLFYFLHKIFLPFRINQQLFVFKKNIKMSY